MLLFYNQTLNKIKFYTRRRWYFGYILDECTLRYNYVVGSRRNDLMYAQYLDTDERKKIAQHAF